MSKWRYVQQKKEKKQAAEEAKKKGKEEWEMKEAKTTAAEEG